MSATNGQRARFHRERKRRVIRLMKTRELKAILKGNAVTDAPAAKSEGRAGPALGAK